jgi:hypothetical protein
MVEIKRDWVGDAILEFVDVLSQSFGVPKSGHPLLIELGLILLDRIWG